MEISGSILRFTYSQDKTDKVCQVGPSALSARVGQIKMTPFLCKPVTRSRSYLAFCDRLATTTMQCAYAVLRHAAGKE